MVDPAPAPARSTVHSAVRTRILAPDIARGLALFGIAWANLSTAWSLVDPTLPGAYFGGIREGSLLDEIFVVFSAMFAHVRGLPMFTTLLGFGVGLITMSLSRRGYPPRNARRALLRRYGFLALLGAVHLVLLFYGDIMVQYGLLAMLLALLITFRDKTLLWIGGVLLGLNTGITLINVVAALYLGAGDSLAMSEWIPEFSTYAQYLGFNSLMLGLVVVSAPATAISLLPLMILGFVAARRGVHLNPGAYSRHLWAWVWVTVFVVLGVGLPWGLSAVGVLPAAWETFFLGLNAALGYLTGPGIAAAVLLACRPLQEKIDAARARGEEPTLPGPLRVITALGRRSMSGYIFQSLLLLVLVMPFTLNLAEGIGAAGYFLLALGVWLLSLLGAGLLELAGLPGPFEKLHRRLSYGRDGLMDPWRPREILGKRTAEPGEQGLAAPAPEIDPAAAPPENPGPH